MPHIIYPWTEYVRYYSDETALTMNQVKLYVNFTAGKIYFSIGIQPLVHRVYIFIADKG